MKKKNLQKQLAFYHTQEIQQIIQQLPVEHDDRTFLVVGKVRVPHLDALKQIAFQYKVEYETLLVVLGTSIGQKAYIAVLVSESLQQRSGKNASDFIQSMAPFIDGKGGGHPLFATLVGNAGRGVEQALHQAKKIYMESRQVDNCS